jgi:hypothetical protein
MTRTVALLTGAAMALGWLALVPDANAHVRYFGRYGYYYGDPSFGRSPMYAADRPAIIKAAEQSPCAAWLGLRCVLFLCS